MCPPPSRIAGLEQQKAAAVTAERYEEAAALKKQIFELAPALEKARRQQELAGKQCEERAMEMLGGSGASGELGGVVGEGEGEGEGESEGDGDGEDSDSDSDSGGGAASASVGTKVPGLKLAGLAGQSLKTQIFALPPAAGPAGGWLAAEPGLPKLGGPGGGGGGGGGIKIPPLPLGGGGAMKVPPLALAPGGGTGHDPSGGECMAHTAALPMRNPYCSCKLTRVRPREAGWEQQRPGRSPSRVGCSLRRCRWVGARNRCWPRWAGGWRGRVAPRALSRRDRAEALTRASTTTSTRTRTFSALGCRTESRSHGSISASSCRDELVVCAACCGHER